MKRLESVNEFVVKFANVNGSGSASANELFAKAILRMGVPVSPGTRTSPRSSPAATCSTTARGRSRPRPSATTSP